MNKFDDLCHLMDDLEKAVELRTKSVELNADDFWESCQKVQETRFALLVQVLSLLEIERLRYK